MYYTGVNVHSCLKYNGTELDLEVFGLFLKVFQLYKLLLE